MLTGAWKATSSENAYSIIISEADCGAKGGRADRLLCKKSGLPSRSQLKSWFDSGRIRRRGEVLKPSAILFLNDVVEVETPPKRESNIEPREMSLQIFHEDEDLIVLYKPKGLTMHPGAAKGDPTTLVHGLLAHSKNLSQRGGEFRPGIVHRLDKDTEGIVVVAKNDFAHEALARQFEDRSLERKYWALCFGEAPARMTIEAPIGRHPVQRKKMAVRPLNGKPATTEIRRLKYFEKENYSWVECQLKTGRTHQIRVHLSYKKFPVLGDSVYGRKRTIKWSEKKAAAYEALQGQALCAFLLGFSHPRTGEKLRFQVDSPEWLQTFLED